MYTRLRCRTPLATVLQAHSSRLSSPTPPLTHPCSYPSTHSSQVIFGSISALLALVVIISLLVHQRHKLPSYRLYLSLACANFLSGLAWATPNDFTWQSPSRAAACWDDSLANGMLYTIVLIEIGILGFTLGHVKFHKPKFSEVRA